MPFIIDFIIKKASREVSIAIVFAISALLIFPLSAGAATIGKPVSNIGLIGHWSLDERSGTIAHDLSGNLRHGTLTNGPSWINGRKGAAATFDATDDYIEVADYDALSPSTLSLSLWVKWDGVRYVSATSRDWASPVAKGSFSSGEYTILLHRDSGSTDTDLRFYINGTTQVVWSNSQIDTNWHHLAATYDGSTAKIYFDGVEKASASATPVVPNTTFPFTMGKNQNAGYFWGGGLDDVRVYGRALSSGEVSALYYSGQALKLAASKTGLAGHWSFNEGSGTVAHDQSGNGNNGTLANGPVFMNGKRDKALAFDGTDDTFSVSSYSQLSPGTSDFTIALWMKTSGPGDILMGSGGGNAGSFGTGFGLVIPGGWACSSSNKLLFNMANGTTRDTAVCSNSSVTTNTWKHVVIVADRGVDVKIYIDGILDASSASSLTGSVDFSTFDIGIARWQNRYAGLLDDIRLYHRALSATEVAALYASTETIVNRSQANEVASGLVGYWSFNGQDVQSSVADGSGQGNHGYFFGGATSTAKTIGKVGQGLSFDGSNDYVAVADSASLDIGTNSLTISVWTKLASSTGTRRIVSKRSGGLGAGYSLVTTNEGLPYIEILSASTYITASGPTTINDGKWHHVAGVIDRGGMGYVCVDGVCGTSANFSSMSSVDLSNTLTLDIGYLAQCGCAFYNGTLDEVRIYNRALSLSELKRLYNMGR